MSCEQCKNLAEWNAIFYPEKVEEKCEKCK